FGHSGVMRNAPSYRPLVDLETNEERHIIMTYRLNRLCIKKLVAHLKPDLLPGLRNPHAIPRTVQVLSVLHFLASGSFQVTVGLAAGSSQPKFCEVLQDVLDAILMHVHRYIRFSLPPDFPTVKAAFYNISKVPHVIGAIDGTRIALVPPRINEQVYRNRKSTYSLNVQVVCLADQYITHVNAKFLHLEEQQCPCNDVTATGRKGLA
ncbi:hypothetical protein NDU88_006647, partial [Pleurodeles waltl]